MPSYSILHETKRGVVREKRVTVTLHEGERHKMKISQLEVGGVQIDLKVTTDNNGKLELIELERSK